MNDEQTEILRRNFATSLDELPPLARLEYANATLSAEETQHPGKAYRVAADVEDFQLDGDKMLESGFQPLTRMQMAESFELIAMERKRRSLGSSAISDDAYFGELTALKPYLSDYSATVVERILAHAKRV